MSLGKKLYESAQVWDQELQLGQKNLVLAIKDLFPTDVETVLDVGCGDGKITSALIQATGKQIVGLDFSEEALSRCEFDTVRGDATELPFGDAEFDLVMTTDVLEHLPQEIENLAWKQLFRVARKAVLVAVPFREELLDATTCCEKCGTKYHVNWHMRAYDWPELLSRAPDGWHASLVILSGESWPPYHPIETCYRRKVLGEWANWTEAVCPTCGHTGATPVQPSTLPSATAAALGELIYTDLLGRGVCRNNSEIIVLYRRSASDLVQEKDVSDLATIVRDQNACCVSLIDSPPHVNLEPYPRSARVVAATDGGLVVQFPVYDQSVKALKLHWDLGAKKRAVAIALEDAYGLVFSGDLIPLAGQVSTIELPRGVTAGYYGVLLRLPANPQISAIELGGGPQGIFFRPTKPGLSSYHPFDLPGCAALIQVTEPKWYYLPWISDQPRIHRSGESGWLLRAIHLGTAGNAEDMQLRLASLQAKADLLAAHSDALKIEIEALRAQADELRPGMDTLRSEVEAVKQKVGALNAECELLRSNVGRLELEKRVLRKERDSFQADRDRLCAELDLLKSRAEVCVSTKLRSVLNKLEMRVRGGKQ